MAAAADLGLKPLKYEDIRGGSSVEDAARIFMQILEGKGTAAQVDVVVANAAMALYCVQPDKGMADSVVRAREALQSGKAFQSFRKLLEG